MMAPMSNAHRPTTAQVSLAIDILSGLEMNDDTRCLRQKAASIVASALAQDDWTGGEHPYGSPAVPTDMNASRKVLLMDKIMEAGALRPASARENMLCEDAKAIYGDGG